jgi:acyl-CoA thioesterase FadM
VTDTDTGVLAAVGSTVLVPVDRDGRVVSLPDGVFRLLAPCEEVGEKIPEPAAEP